jgi:hypothetical protein
MSNRVIVRSALLLALAALAWAGGAAAQPGSRPPSSDSKPGTRPPSPDSKPGSRPSSPSPGKPGSRTPSPGPGRQLPDSAYVIRGGTCTPDSFARGSGVQADDDDKLSGVSVNSAANRTIGQLTQGVPHRQVGVTTVGDIRRAGGQVVPDPTRGNPHHALVSGVSAAKLSELFSKGRQENPNAKAKPKPKSKKGQPKAPAKSNAA